MHKDVRNLLITGIVACFIGIIMGVGLVAPSIEPIKVGKDQMVVSVGAAEIMEQCVSESKQCQEDLGTCQVLTDQIVEQALIAQKHAKDALNLVDRCLNVQK